MRRYLVRNGIPHRYFDIEQNPSAERELRWLTGSYAYHPTLLVDGEVCVEPSFAVLDEISGGVRVGW